MRNDKMGGFRKKSWDNCECSSERIKKMAEIYFKELSLELP
jgi:hypothetical protein